jgi:hypothetical protein
VKPESPSVIAARAEVERARRRLIGSFDDLQNQFAPQTLMREAWESARDKGADLAENAVDAVRKRPVAATSVVAAIALFLAREPLMDLAGKVTGKAKRKLTRKSPPKARPKTKSTEKLNDGQS